MIELSHRFIPIRITILLILLIAIIAGLAQEHGRLTTGSPRLSQSSLQANLVARAAIWSRGASQLEALSRTGPTRARVSTAANPSARPRPPQHQENKRPGAQQKNSQRPDTRRANTQHPAPNASSPLQSPVSQKQIDEAISLLMAQGSPEGRRDAGALALYLGRPMPAGVIQKAPTVEEAGLWQMLAARGPLSLAAARRLEEISRSWKMGWYRSLLLSKAFALAAATAPGRQKGGQGPQELARHYDSAAFDAAAASIVELGLLTLLVLAAVIAGVALGIVGLVLWKSLKKLPSPLQLAPALPLIEAAVLWLFLMMFGVEVIKPFLSHVSPSMLPLIAVGNELVIGIGVIGFLRWWMGWNGTQISLPSHRGLKLLLQDAKWGVVGYVCLLPWLLLAAIVSSKTLDHWYHAPPTPDNPAISMMAHARSPLDLFLMFLLACVLAPIFEERFFRGALYPALRQRLPTWAAACITGAIFAGIHPQVPLGFLPIFVLGAGFCLLYELRGSTAASIVAHGLNNTVVFIVVWIISRT